LTFLDQLREVLEFRPSGQPMTLLAAMINVAVTALYADTVDDGIRLHVWQEPQLAALEEQLKEINLRPEVLKALMKEQAAVAGEVEQGSLAHVIAYETVPDPPPSFRIIPLLPRGWAYLNLVSCEAFHQRAREFFDSERLDFEGESLQFERAINGAAGNWFPINILAAVSIPNYPRACLTSLHNQTAANQARMACALERYRLAHGEYPATLEALTPQLIDSIPRDLIGGQPPHYRRNADGTFLLYSIGWSGQDYGGRSDPDVKLGDWVWPQG
jgi:hypothetical protein